MIGETNDGADCLTYLRHRRWKRSPCLTINETGHLRWFWLQ